VRAVNSAIEMEAQPGLLLQASRLQGLTSAGKGLPLHFTSNSANYEASFTVKAAPVPSSARLFTLVERQLEMLEMTTALHLNPRRGPVTVTVSGWTGHDLALEVPEPIVQESHKVQGNQHVWTLHLPAGLPETVTLTLAGRAAIADSSARWKLPTIDFGPVEDHWVGLIGFTPANKDVQALRTIAGPPKGGTDYPPPPRGLPTGTQVVRLTDGHGGLLLVTPTGADARLVQILLARQEAAWGGAGWVHELNLLAFSRGASELKLRLPANAVCRAVLVGDRVTVPGAGEVVIPLAGPAGPQRVKVIWTYTEGTEGPETPRLDAPTVDGLNPADLQRTLWLPSEYQLAPPLPALAARAAETLLQDAEARLRLCALWAETSGAASGLVREQQMLQVDLEQVRARAAAIARAGDSASAAELRRKADQVENENTRLAKKGGYTAPPRPPGIAASQAFPLSIATTGLPVVWRPDSPPALISELDVDRAFARTATEAVLLAVLGLLVISLLRRGISFLQTIWPETLVALALVGFSLAGPSILGGILLTAGVGLRLLALGLAIRRVMPRWFTQAPTPRAPDTGATPLPQP
jgi:hypothetical protein